MKIIRISVIVFLMLAVFACNNKQSKKAENDDPANEKPVSEKSIIKKIDNIKQKKINLCEDIVTEILTTCPRYIQLTKGLNKAVIKNGGQSFEVKLEASPYSTQNKAWGYSKTYDFTVYEMYTDRELNIARFSFNPDNKQLYEYDVIEDKLEPIEFDRNLLSKYEALCK